jgi:BASS family bile acid:Na+ symporter
VGLFCQLVLLPTVAFIFLLIFPQPPELSVGVMLISFCPGGATSNLISNLARADVALSITLTAIASIVTVFSIPLLVNYSMEYFMGEGMYLELPVAKTMIQILAITVIPVSIGMVIRWKYPDFSIRSEKPVKIMSAVFITIIIAGVYYGERENIREFFLQVGLITLLINLAILLIGYYVSGWFKLSHPQRSAVSIEGGIQNGTLAITIATSTFLLNNSEMAIPPAVYSLIMFFTGFLAVYVLSRRKMFE